MVRCFCCDRILEAESTDNPIVIYPVYDGLIFRANGNFGSTVYDPLPRTGGGAERLQIIICDDCIRIRAKRVTRIHNIKRNVTADEEPFDVDGR